MLLLTHQVFAEHFWASQNIPELMVVSHDFQENPHDHKSDTLDLQGQCSPTVWKYEYTLPCCFENKAKPAFSFDWTILESSLLSLLALLCYLSSYGMKWEKQAPVLYF